MAQRDGKLVVTTVASHGTETRRSLYDAQLHVLSSGNRFDPVKRRPIDVVCSAPCPSKASS
jgi:cyanophycinase-like exopeptidase